MKQDYKIVFNNSEVLFFSHSFKSALDHANEFIERNKSKFSMKLYKQNYSNYGKRWIFMKEINV